MNLVRFFFVQAIKLFLRIPYNSSCKQPTLTTFDYHLYVAHTFMDGGDPLTF